MQRNLSFAPSVPVGNTITTLERLPEVSLEIPEAAPPVWRHTLVLTGCLDAQSGPELQDEIECLYQEGVTSLVLDIGSLEAVELVGAQAIASLSALYERRGLSVAVLGGPAWVHHTMIEAETLHRRVTPRHFTHLCDEGLGPRSTEMTKEL
ncbi:MAG TPA: STAS domain-containing protein [Solirubrobacteraceae bacterium]|nr:STAS domain-containing protein [Solirubrobacteraceae bacterium]